MLLFPAICPAKVQMDKVTGILGSTSTADFIVQGSRVTDLDTGAMDEGIPGL